ncbi:MAG: PspA/IM30 family protein [Cyanobacteriota bacterium]|nr:PspA/IM30 family protein [Cyanobacteriota bacterium]
MTTSLLDRAWRTVRAHANHFLEANEDPEQRLERVVAQMQTELLSLRQAVARAIATHKRTERQQQQERSMAEDWQHRARVALEQGNQNLARAALTRRQAYLKTEQLLQERLAQQGRIIQQMRVNLRSLEQKIAEAKTKKEMFVARARSAEAMRRLHELNSSSSTVHKSVFENMEDKVMQLEAEVQLMVESSQNRLEEKFGALERSHESEQGL